MKNFTCELRHDQEKFIVNSNDQSAVHLAKNFTYHS